MSVKITVYTCLCGEKSNLSQLFEDIWPVLIVDGLWVVIKSVISMALRSMLLRIISGEATTRTL